MKEIKVKPEDRKPKLMNETARVPKTAMKDLWLKSKEKSVIELKETPFASQRGESSNDPANNAGNQMLSGTETTVKRGAELTYRGGKNLVQTTARIIKEKREMRRRASTTSRIRRIRKQMQRPLFRFPPAHSLLRVLKMMSISSPRSQQTTATRCSRILSQL